VLSGATVAITGGGSTTTDGTGAYSFQNLTVGTYQLTASKSGYLSSTASGIPVNDGQTTAQDFSLTPRPIISTNFLAPTANAAVTKNAGDNNGFQTSPANAYAADNVFASDPSSGTAAASSCTSTKKDKHLFYNFGFSLPGSSTLRGIEVQLKGRAASTSGSPHFCIQLSRDGGLTWSAAKMTTTLSATNTAFTLGSTTDLWGLSSWTAAHLGNANFRVRIIDAASVTSQTFYLDALSVRATYQ